MEKKTVAVIFGGQSSEHEVSRLSATFIINNLDREKYDVLMLGINKSGAWFLYEGDVSKIADGSWEKDEKLSKAVISPSSADKGLIVFRDDSAFELVKIDVVFPVLHGAYGEDGTIQGLLELSGIAYVGCGVLASSVGMNKIYTKMVFEKAGLNQAKWTAVYDKNFDNIDGEVERVASELGFPLYVKPANAGSSVGISRVETKEELKKALLFAAEHDRQIVVEEAVVGREVECSVLGNDTVFAAAVGEIVAPGSGFYDYDEKYKSDTTKLVIPAKLEDDIYEQVRASAIKAFEAVDGAGLSRVDFFVRTSDNCVIINEINTLPGFTAISMYPKLWSAAGKEAKELLDELISLAQKRRK